MNDRISALMDSELDDESAAATIDALGRDSGARHTWRTYQMIGDTLRDSRLLSGGFTARVAARLADEPTVLAPGRFAARQRTWYALSAAASLAAVSLVGWMAYAPQLPLPSAAAPQPAAVAQAMPEAQPVLVPLPTAANDYLLAHQGFSPRMWLQGMAPYVRTVSEHPQEPRR